MSSLSEACPHCHEPVGKLDQEQRERLALRRWRTRVYRARNLTYLAMGLVVAGMLVWWISPPQGLSPPVGMPAALLLGVGFVGYAGSWGWLLWLRFMRAPKRSA